MALDLVRALRSRKSIVEKTGLSPGSVVDVSEQEKLQALADSVPGWWHSIDFGHGVVTKGHKSADTLKREMSLLRIPDARGKSVLDVGAWDGFYTFAAERTGASRVVALDHYVWSLDLAQANRLGQQCPRSGTRVPE